MQDKAETAILKGKRAFQILDEPVVQEAFAQIEKEVFEAFKKTRPTDTEGREKLYMTVSCLELFKDRLNRMVSAGQMAASNLDWEAQQGAFEQLNKTSGELS
jgi:hypothetical protein